jgi:hypothetical protein
MPCRWQVQTAGLPVFQGRGAPGGRALLVASVGGGNKIRAKFRLVLFWLTVWRAILYILAIF